MASMRFFGVLALAVFLAACAKRDRLPVDKEPGNAARLGLEGFRKAMTDTVAEVLGFRNADEGRRSHLGRPIPVFEPACDVLLGMEDTAMSLDPRGSRGPDGFYFPILGDQDRKVSLVLVAKLANRDKYGGRGDWSAVQVGSKSLMAKIDALTQKQPEQRRPSLFLVRSFALGAAFLGYEANGEVRMAPVVLTDSAASCFAASGRGEDMRAAEAFFVMSRCFDKAQICRVFDPEDAKGWGVEPPKGLKR